MREFINIVEGGEITTRTFEMKEAEHPFREYWFNLHFNGEELVGFAEHNQYQGGEITRSPDESWEECFLSRVAAHNPNSVDEATHFLRGTSEPVEYSEP